MREDGRYRFGGTGIGGQVKCLNQGFDNYNIIIKQNWRILSISHCF